MADDNAENVQPKNRAVVSQRVLFVRNLPFSTTDQDLEKLFSEIGPIKRCFVIRNKGSRGLCRGFGYVTFVLAEDAEKAINNVKTFGGRQLSICFSDKKPKHEKRKHKQDEDDDDNREQQESANIKNNKAEELPNYEEEPSRKKLKSDKHDKNLKDSGYDIGRTIVITGIETSGVNPNHIRKKCRKVGTVETVTFPVEGRDKPTAFVMFKSHKDAREAVTKLNGRIFKSNSIEAVLLSREGKTPSQKSLKKSRVIVRNLSFKCKEEDLQKFFSQFGQVTEVKIPSKMEGKRKLSLGFAFVQFSNVFDAAKAIKESNMKEILGRPVAVDWAVPKTMYETKKDEEDKLSEREEEEVEEDKGSEEEDSDDDAVLHSDSEIASDVDAAKDRRGGSDDKDRDDDDDDDGDDDDDDDDDDGDDDNDDVNSEDEDKDHGQKPTLQARRLKQSTDVKEGKTLFIRNVSFDSTEEALQDLFEQFGDMEYCKLVVDKRTGHSKGMAFVKFKTTESAEQCLQETSDEGAGLSLDNFTLNVTKAVTRGKATELAKERKRTGGNKQVKDKRNLYLAKEGLILPGSTAAQELSKSDIVKRQKAEAEKKAKLENPNYFVSTTRLCVRNLPLNVDDKRLKEIFSTVAGRNAFVKKVLIIRSKDRVDSSGRGRSMGYGFVEFANHNDALAALRATNNNPDIFGADRRPIVEFSLENSLVVKVKQRRLDKARQRQQPDSEQPKTNKEKRLEKSQKRREKRQRKREANKERKLEDGKDGKEEKPDTGSKEGKAPNSDVKFQRKKSENSWKTKKGKRTSSAELPAPRNLGKTDRQKQRKFPPISSNVNKSYNEPAVAKANLPAAIQDNKKKKPLKGRGNIGKTFHERADSFTHTNAKNEVTNRKRKGARRKEQDKKDESNFTDMVNKYKNKLFGRDEGEVPAKRSRWFDD